VAQDRAAVGLSGRQFAATRRVTNSLHGNGEQLRPYAAFDPTIDAHASRPMKFNPVRHQSLHDLLSESNSILMRCDTRDDTKLFLSATTCAAAGVRVFENSEVSSRRGHGVGLPAIPVQGGRD